jgi:uncharacterized membrane protein (DUF485 family)
MLKKRGKLLTFIFSMLPGAGHMFMGFMKRGVSFMALFFLVIFIATWLKIGSLTILEPLIWFYAFFDCMNKAYASDEDFLKLTDDYIMTPGAFRGLLKNRSGLIIGIVLVLLGTYVFFSNTIGYIRTFMPEKLYSLIISTSNMIPQLIVGSAIIIIGIWLIIGKKRGSDKL